MPDQRFKDYFSDTAEGYAQHRPRYPKELAHYLASLCSNKHVALDAACGTGQLSVLLAECFQQVVATDASSAQIANAERRDNINYQVATADHSPMADQSVDLITVAQAAHWLNLDGFYADAQRVAKPGAILALVSYGITQVKDPLINQLIQYFYHQVLGGYWPPERQHIVDGYRHLSFPFKEIVAPELFMTADWSCQQLIGYLNTWSAVTQAKKNGQTEMINLFYRQLVEAWSGATSKEVFWDISIRATKM